MTLVLFLSRGTKITPHHSSLLHPVMEILGDGIQEEVDHPAFSGVDIDPQCHAQAHTAVTPFNSTTSTGNIPCGQARGFAAPPETTATRTPCPFVACAPETRDAQNACHRRDLLQRTDCALALSKRDGTSQSPSRLRSLSALFVPPLPLPLRHGRGHPAGEPCASPAHKRLAHNNGTAYRHCRPHGRCPCRWPAATRPDHRLPRTTRPRFALPGAQRRKVFKPSRVNWAETSTRYGTG